MKKIVINSREEMANLAKEIALQAKIGDVIGLKGTLGAGKSFFAKISTFSMFNVDKLVTSKIMLY